MRVLIAPDCFGDTLSADEAAAAIAAGWRDARPGDALTLAPQSDGGPGFVRALAARPGMVLQRTRVRGPLSGRVDAEWALDPGTGTAYLECAQACGLALLPDGPTSATAESAHSGGVGDLIVAAAAAHPRDIVVGLGGSACTDGGRGMVEALGGVGAAMRLLARIGLVAATDVDNPLLGPSGAAAVFAPQKGADADGVRRLEQRLARWADDLETATGRRVRDEAGAGAAGGLGAALLALGARRESGAMLVARRTALAADLDAADLIVTGEGRLDRQTLHGKVVAMLAGEGRARGTPVVVLAGQVALGKADQAAAGIAAAHSLAEYAGSVRRAIGDAPAQLSGLARRTAADLRRE